MNTLVLLFEDHVDQDLVGELEARQGAEVLDVEAAWNLFLRRNGRSAEGLDVPPGNPRATLGAVNAWLRQTLGGQADMIGGARDTRLLAVLPRCSAAAREYVLRHLSLYSQTVGLLECAGRSLEELEAAAGAFYEGGHSEFVRDGWVPPVVSLTEELTPLLQKTSKRQDGNDFTWFGALLGSDRLFAQTYRMQPHASGNRLHSHSDVDEMYVVLEGSGFVQTLQGMTPLQKGDLVPKPAGSSLATKFIAGAEGMTILDIEVWMRSDQTDVCTYPDHREILLRGRALNHGAPVDAVFPADAIQKYYTEDYVRDAAGDRKPQQR